MRFAMYVVAAAIIAAPLDSFSQTYSPPQKDSARDTATAKKPAPPTPALDFSGILFANFQYRGEAGPSKSFNKFDVERAYLTFRIPAGDHASVRITTDLFQQTTSGNDNFYRGWVVRAKYAYLQYNYLNGAEWKANARIGILHTVFVDHEEQYWPRWISLVPTERAGYFSSADGGLATTISLPRKWGEIYATITNGPGYTSRETDRFKDYAARLTLTPWSSGESKFMRTVALTGWAYKGATASKFVNPAPGEVGPIGAALDRDRWGVFAGANDPRFTFGVDYASRHEEGETGLNTIASPRNVTDSTGRLVAAYAVLRPFGFSTPNALEPLTLLGRFDRVTVNTDTDSKYNVVIGGIAWDLSKRASVSLDYQEVTPVEGKPITATKTYFAHFVARF
jgi:hypothetical protein